MSSRVRTTMQYTLAAIGIWFLMAMCAPLTCASPLRFVP